MIFNLKIFESFFRIKRFQSIVFW